MKKKTAIICILALILSVFSGCCLKHEWQPATCEAPETCASCGETQGEPLGHSWQAATCEAPETCDRCGKTQGAPLGHSWQAATCEAPETCAACGETRGETGHSWQAATCETPETCSLCGETRGEPVEHTLRGETLFETGETYTLTCICTLCGTEIKEQTDDWSEASKQLVLGKWVANNKELTLEVFADGTVVFDIGIGPIEGTWETNEILSWFRPYVPSDEGGLVCTYVVEAGEDNADYYMYHMSYPNGDVAIMLQKGLLGTTEWLAWFHR